MAGLESLLPSQQTPPQASSQAGGLASLIAQPKAPSTAAKPWYEPVTHALGEAQKKGVAALQWASNTPVARGADAVLNADTRASMAAIAGKNPLAQGVLDPANATNLTHAAEQRLHLPQFVNDQNEKTANGWQRAGQGIEDFGVETLGTPTTYIPFFGEAEALKRIGRFGLVAGTGAEAVRALSKTAPVARGLESLVQSPIGRTVSDIAQRTKNATVEFAKERQDVTRPGEDIVKMHESAGRSYTRRQEQNYADLVELNRPQLEQYEQARKSIEQEVDKWKPAADAGSATAKAELERLEGAWQQTKQLFPERVRQANLQQAYREGDQPVRQQVLAKGYIPTPDDRKLPVLNILHNFNDEYEPTQRLMSDAEKADLDKMREQGPVEFRQGNRKAKFDLPKGGGTPDTPLADRLLDRFVTGTRLENYHHTRLKISQGLGLLALAKDNRSRTVARLSQEQQHLTSLAPDAPERAASERRVALLEKLLERQNADQAAAATTRETTLKPNFQLSNQAVELISPKQAERQALKDTRFAGNPMERVKTIVTPGGQRRKIIVPIASGDRKIDTRSMQGKIKGLNRNVLDAERAAQKTRAMQAKAEAIASTPKGMESAILREGEHVEGGAQRLEDRGIANLAQTENLARKGFGGKPVESFNPASLGAAAFPKKVSKDYYSPPDLASQRKIEAAMKPLYRVAGSLQKNTADASKPFERLLEAQDKAAQRFGKSVARPAAANAAWAEKRKTTAILRQEQHVRNLAVTRQYNADVKEMGKHGKDIGKAINSIPLPENLKHRLYGAVPHYNKSLAAMFSDLQRNALFVIPLAHMKNIAVLTLLGPGGAKTLARGMKYAHDLRVNPASLDQRRIAMEQMGGTEHYISETAPEYQNVLGGKLGDFADKGNRALERYDLGMRFALEDELRAKGLSSPAEIGGQIRDVLGDYTNQAPMIRELRARYGASFPGWGLGVVPRAMTKAARENPSAFAAYARANRLASNDVTEPTMSTGFDLGGPAEDYSHLLERPDQFLESPSRLGWPGALIGLTNAMAYGEPLNYLGEQAARLIPFSSPVQAAANMPFPSNANGAARAGAGLVGAYFPNEKARRTRENELSRLGFKGQDLQVQLRAEGYR